MYDFFGIILSRVATFYCNVYQRCFDGIDKFSSQQRFGDVSIRLPRISLDFIISQRILRITESIHRILFSPIRTASFDVGSALGRTYINLRVCFVVCCVLNKIRTHVSRFRGRSVYLLQPKWWESHNLETWCTVVQSNPRYLS